SLLCHRCTPVKCNSLRQLRKTCITLKRPFGRPIQRV
ncbi:hypothetical protein D030_1172B, partial [Vibrio parahaemolyticus AQ3810]